MQYKYIICQLLLISSLKSYCQDRYNDIDSVIKRKYTVESQKYFKNKNLKEKDEKLIIDKLIYYKTSENSDERKTVSDLLFSMATFSIHLKIRRKAAFHEIDMYWIGQHYRDHNLYPKELFTKKTIKRIAEIIQGMNETEINIRILDEIQRRLNNNNVNYKIKSLQKKTGLSLIFCEDSIKKEIVMYENNVSRQEFKTKEVCRPEFIKIIGWLNCKEYIPLFESLLNDQRFKDKSMQEALKYALARMGVRKYVDEFLQRQDFDYVYLHTQEAYWCSIEKNYSYDDYDKVYPDIRGKWPAANSAEITLYLMSKYILNLPKEYQLNDYGWTTAETAPAMNEKARKAYEWFKANRGKYLLKDLDYIGH
jgi:hypothetical protein